MSQKNPLPTPAEPHIPIQLPPQAQMKDYQDYIDRLEKHHGWDQVDLVHNCFLMGEEVGELFKGVRKYLKYAQEQTVGSDTDLHTTVAELKALAVNHHATDTSHENSKTTGSIDQSKNMIVAQDQQRQAKENIAEEIVDVFNYLLAIANRLDIDVEKAFIEKNLKNQKRSWH